jgi:hypothetical protein
MSTHGQLLEAVAGGLPPVPGEVTGALHVLAVVGAVYVFNLGGAQFSGRGVELFGRQVTSREALAGLVVVGGLVATARWWAPVAFVLTGWQALGLVALEVGWLLQSTADGVDPWAAVTALVGLALLVLPWVA